MAYTRGADWQSTRASREGLEQGQRRYSKSRYDECHSEVWLARRSRSKHDSSTSGSNRNPDRGFNSTRSDSEFQRDRARIIHSSSFRALQSKTQVLGLGESDFYRTRLTHSLEVAQIGSGVAEWLREHESNAERRALIPSFSLIEAICLAHDIGHSPFGHGGEIAMNAMMRADGGFEANGQTLRILARLGEYSDSDGLDLTRRSMLGTIKYPALYSATACYAEGLPSPAEQALNIDHWEPPKCLYDTEADVLAWLLEPFSAADRDRLTALESPPEPGTHRRTRHKPFDTSIMELADDIAYGVHDLEDALALSLVHREVWDERVSKAIRSMALPAPFDDMDLMDRRLFAPAKSGRKHAISMLVGYFIREISLTEDEAFEHPLLSLKASMSPDAYAVLLMIKKFVMNHVIKRPELQHLQYKGQRVIITLFDIFRENPRRLLPEHVFLQYERTGLRAIADYLSAMTDVSAGKLYHKLLSPASGSIYDRP